MLCDLNFIQHILDKFSICLLSMYEENFSIFIFFLDKEGQRKPHKHTVTINNRSTFLRNITFNLTQ